MEQRETSYKIIVTSVVIAILIWVLDAFVEHLFFSDLPFMNLLLYDIPSRDLFIRGLIVLSFLVFGIILSKTVERHTRTEEAL